MRLRRVAIRRMPGIEQGVELDDLNDGLNLIVGPNGSGKTALCRAFRAAVWKELESGRGFSGEVVWSTDRERLSVRRDGERVMWQRDGSSCEPPLFPDVYSARCFTLDFRDLLLGGAPADEAVAVEIRKQVSGGYDLARVVAECLGLRPRHGLNEDNRLRERSRDLELVRRSQRELAEKEIQLVALERELDAARVSAARLEPLRAAIEMRRVEAELGSIDRRIEELPTDIGSVRGDEDAHLREIGEERGKLELNRAECKERIERLEAERGRLSPPAGVPADAVLKTWVHRARTLHQQEHELRQAQRALSEADATRQTAAAGLDPEDRSVTTPRVGDSELGEVEAFVERAARLKRRREQLIDEREALGDDSPVTESEDDLDRSSEALQAWLAASSVRAVGWSRWAAVLSLAPLAGAVGLWRMGSDPLLIVASGTAGVVLLAAAVVSRIFHPSGRRMRAARRRFDELGASPPSAWKDEAVRQRLREVQQARSDAAFATRRDQRRTELTARLDALDGQQAAIDEERVELRGRFGIDPGGGELAPLRLLQRVERYQVADAKYREARVTLERIGRQHAESLQALNGFVGEAGLATVSDAASALAALDDLRDRGRRLQHIGEQAEREARRLDEIDQLAAEVDGKRDQVFVMAALEPGDEDGLRLRLQSRPGYLSLIEERRSQRGRADDLRRRVADYAGSLEFDEERLAGLALEAEQSGDRVVALAHELGQIRQAVRDARSGQLLEDALAGVEEAREKLTACRDEALFKTAGRFLVDRVSDEFDLHSRPEILSHAIDLFGRFTHQRFELKIDLRDGAPQFRAVEVETGQGKALSELSAATRLQLLLAARLAYVKHIDPRARLPLLLDEVLATSDPERFAAIAESLLMIAREEGRQILYFTSDPADVVRWQRVLSTLGLPLPRVFDLAAIRGLASGVGDDGELNVPPLPQVPSPVDTDAERYGALLGVPRVDCGRSVNSLHLFHLLRQDLVLLHQLLTTRIRTVGQWRRLAATGDGALLVGVAPARRLSALADVAEAYFDSWRIGRGRPIDSTVLAAADVSETWIAKLESLVDEQQGDASRLLDALTVRIDERTKGFHARVRQRLRGYLIAGGFLDERELLDEHEIHARVQAAVVVHVENGPLTADDVATLVHQLFHQAGKPGTTNLESVGKDDTTPRAGLPLRPDEISSGP